MTTYAMLKTIMNTVILMEGIVVMKLNVEMVFVKITTILIIVIMMMEIVVLKNL